MAQHLSRPSWHRAQRSARSFTSSAASRMKIYSTKPEDLLPKGALSPPPYPYGPARWYKQQDLGLYGGKQIQFGHNVSEKNEIKTLRQWHPNIQKKWLYSDALAQKIRTRVSTRVLRTIDKVGGLDAYLTGGGTARMKELGEYGWKLRWAVLHASSVRKRLRSDPHLREMLGIDAGQIMGPNYLPKNAPTPTAAVRKGAPRSGPSAVTTPASQPTRTIPKKSTTQAARRRRLIESGVTSKPEISTSRQDPVEDSRSSFMVEEPVPEPVKKPDSMLTRIKNLVTNPFRRR